MKIFIFNGAGIFYLTPDILWIILKFEPVIMYFQNKWQVMSDSFPAVLLFFLLQHVGHHIKWDFFV